MATPAPGKPVLSLGLSVAPRAALLCALGHAGRLRPCVPASPQVQPHSVPVPPGDPIHAVNAFGDNFVLHIRLLCDLPKDVTSVLAAS